MPKSLDEKFRTVIEKNTFYFFNPLFEERYEGYLNSLRETLLILRNEVKTQGLSKAMLQRFLVEKEDGLNAILALTGFSNESLKRLITLIRVADDQQLAALSLRDEWCVQEELAEDREWSDARIARMIRENESFRKGIVNVFFEGATVRFLAETMPLFELKKLSIAKLEFDVAAIIDTLVRYKVKGSYSGRRENNPETVIAQILSDLGIGWESGDLGELILNAPDTKRRMDFIIPGKQQPQIMIESSFLVTTSSIQGDKSKAELSVRDLVAQHYPNSRFFGFVDGIGWYVRREDLRRMVTAYDDVFTFHRDELSRFRELMSAEFGKNA